MEEKTKSGKRISVTGVLSVITGWGQIKSYKRTVQKTLNDRAENLKSVVEKAREEKKANDNYLEQMGKIPFADFRATDEKIKQARQHFLMQKRVALVILWLVSVTGVFFFFLSLIALFSGMGSYLLRAGVFSIVCASLSLISFIYAYNAEFNGWKLVNRINTHEEGATAGAFRTDNGIRRTLRFSQCGFMRGEK